MDNECNREAMDLLRWELSNKARGALAHLLNNALQPIVLSIGTPTEIKNLVELVRKITIGEGEKNA